MITCVHINIIITHQPQWQMCWWWHSCYQWTLQGLQSWSEHLISPKKTRPGPIQNLTLEPLVCPKVHLDKNIQSKRTKTIWLHFRAKMFFPKPEHMRQTQPGKLQQGRIWGCKEKQNTSGDFRNISPFLKQCKELKNRIHFSIIPLPFNHYTLSHRSPERRRNYKKLFHTLLLWRPLWPSHR